MVGKSIFAPGGGENHWRSLANPRKRLELESLDLYFGSGHSSQLNTLQRLRPVSLVADSYRSGIAMSELAPWIELNRSSDSTPLSSVDKTEGAAFASFGS